MEKLRELKETMWYGCGVTIKKEVIHLSWGMRKILWRKKTSEASLQECFEFESQRGQVYSIPRIGSGRGGIPVKHAGNHWSGWLKLRQAGVQRSEQLHT